MKTNHWKHSYLPEIIIFLLIFISLIGYGIYHIHKGLPEQIELYRQVRGINK